jgi:cell division protein FtsQ
MAKVLIPQSVKEMRGNASASSAETYRPELIEDEPRYLRRQKPVEIRRKKFGGKSWSFYKKAMAVGAVGVAVISVGALTIRFLLYSPKMALLKPDQIEVTGNHIVTREAVLQQFVRDRNRGLLRVPLDARREAVEELTWVESASVERILPDRLRVVLTERTPIALVRMGRELALMDAQGVILDRPKGRDFQFPIVTGIAESVPRAERAKLMRTYQEFLSDIDLVRSGSSDRVSEVDFSGPRDVRVVMTGLAAPNDPQAVTMHFGDADFTGKYRMVVENFAQWQAANGRVQSIDLQYAYQVILNPDTSTTASVKTK